MKPETTKNYIVSVQMITYNHESYIAQAIEGVVMQKTSFKFELIIGEDCSTDFTRKICEYYAEKFPEIIRLLPSVQNLGMNKNGNRTLIACTGKYVAICEGDDYWTDPNKLQKQVDFLEENPEYSMCCTNFYVINENGTVVDENGWGKNMRKDEITHLEMLEYYTPKTLTTVLRKNLIPQKFPEDFYQVANGDSFLFALISQHGPAKYLNIKTGCYRLNQGSNWSMKSDMKRNEMKYNTFKYFKKYFTQPEEQKAINARLSRTLIIRSKFLFKRGDIFRHYTTL